MTQARDNDQASYWNEEGGRRWVENIERVERMLAPLSEHLLRLAAPAPGERVLDVGCGGGITSAALARAVSPGGRVLGLDVSAVILDVARRRFAAQDNLEFALGDAATMPLPAAGYDLVTSRFGVMFFPDPVGAFTHLRAALAPAGRLAFVCWQAPERNPWMALAVQAAFGILPRPEPQPPDAPGPFAYADPVRLRGILEAAGFGAVEIEGLERAVDLGPPDDAVKQLTRMGPAAGTFDAADPATRARVEAAVGAVFAPHVQAGRVTLGSATWLVQARPA